MLGEIPLDRLTDTEIFVCMCLAFSAARRLDLIDLPVKPAPSLRLGRKAALPSPDAVFIDEAGTPARGELLDAPSLPSRHR
jgi:hypothetical protein